MHIANKITSLGNQGQFEKAYQLARKGTKDQPQNRQLIQAIQTITTKLRDDCYTLASNKATEFSKELKEKEALLRKFNALTG